MMINTPDYAIPLVTELEKRGHEVGIIVQKQYEKSSNKKFIEADLDTVYSGRNIETISGIKDAKQILFNSDIDIFLTELTQPNSNKLAREVHKYAKKKVKVLEMDNRATESLTYCHKNWKYKSQYSPYKSVRLLGSLKSGISRASNIVSAGYFGKKTFSYKPKLYSDVLTLKGPWWKTQLKKSLPQRNHKSLSVTGSLRSDSIKSTALKYDNSKVLDLDSSKDTVVFCPIKSGNIFNKYPNWLIKKYAKILEKNFDLNIVFKLHPGDILTSRKTAFSEKNYNICKVEDFYSILSKSKAVISQFSTVGLDSAIFNVPSLFFEKYQKTGGMESLFLQDNMKVGHGINSKNICNVFESILDNKIDFQFQNFNKEVLNSIDGKSHHNIANKIEKLLTQGG